MYYGLESNSGAGEMWHCVHVMFEPVIDSKVSYSAKTFKVLLKRVEMLS